MVDVSTVEPGRTLRTRIDKALLLIAAVLGGLAVFAPDELTGTLAFALRSLVRTAPFILFAVVAVAWLKAARAEWMLAGAFEGREARVIVVAAFVGGLAPFCSCEVIPFVAAALAVGAPLGAVMAFWLASPLMDPAMFLITAGTLGTGFAVAKTTAAVGIGLLGGFATATLDRTTFFANPLRPAIAPLKQACCGTPVSATTSATTNTETVSWRFWTEPSRRTAFRTALTENGAFLLKWLLLAYLIEAIMLRHIPAEWITAHLGQGGPLPIVSAAILGGPAYLNGYAAVPLVDALLQKGMVPGAAMSFMIAGGVSCIPAAVAVWALVKPRVFAAYFGFGLAGSILAGLAWDLIA